MRKIAILLAALLFAAPAFGQSPQLGAGQVLGNSTAAQRPGRAENVTAILDQALGSTRGAILERGVSGWAIVGPSATVGLAWVSAGAGADPLYGVVGLAGGGCNAVLTASNGGILYSTASACAILAGTATARLPLLSGASTIPQWGAYTLPASVTSGGIPFFSSTTVQGSSALLTANAIILGGGAGVAPATLGSLGTTTTVLHGNAGGAPTFGAVSLTADVSGQLPLANGGCNGTSKATCFTNAAPTPTRAGDLIYYNGSNWVTLAGNNSGTNVLQEDASGVPSWVASGTGTVTSVTCGTGLTGGTFTTTGTCAIDKATAANLEAGTSNKALTADIIYDAEVTITFAASQTLDFSTFLNARITATANTTSLTCSNIKASQSGIITWVQDGTGSRTMVAGWCSQFRWAGGTRGVLSTAINAIDALFYQCISTTICYVSLGKAQAN